MRNKRLLLLCMVLFVVVFSSSACTQHRYDEEWIIGKTSAEIEARYGSFDRLGMEYQEDGLLYSCRAGYVIRESRTTFLGQTTEKLFVVHFNDKGIAVGYAIAPGNWGG